VASFFYRVTGAHASTDRKMMEGSEVWRQETVRRATRRRYKVHQSTRKKSSIPVQVAGEEGRKEGSVRREKIKREGRRVKGRRLVPAHATLATSSECWAMAGSSDKLDSLAQASNITAGQTKTLGRPPEGQGSEAGPSYQMRVSHYSPSRTAPACCGLAAYLSGRMTVSSPCPELLSSPKHAMPATAYGLPEAPTFCLSRRAGTAARVA
jgi:hypothetical protein